MSDLPITEVLFKVRLVEQINAWLHLGKKIEGVTFRRDRNIKGVVRRVQVRHAVQVKRGREQRVGIAREIPPRLVHRGHRPEVTVVREHRVGVSVAREYEVVSLGWVEVEDLRPSVREGSGVVEPIVQVEVICASFISVFFRLRLWVCAARSNSIREG